MVSHTIIKQPFTQHQFAKRPLDVGPGDQNTTTTSPTICVKTRAIAMKTTCKQLPINQHPKNIDVVLQIVSSKHGTIAGLYEVFKHRVSLSIHNTRTSVMSS